MNAIEELKNKLKAGDLWQGEIVLKRNEYLRTSGTVDTRLYLVVSGSMRIYIRDEDEEQIIRFAYKGSLITALDSFITGEPTDFYIQAIKKTTVKFIDKESYLDFIRKDPENQEIWNQILEQFVHQQLEREKDILTNSPQKRYERVMRRSPRLFQEVPHKYIASYLRMTPETLSRIKKS